MGVDELTPTPTCPPNKTWTRPTARGVATKRHPPSSPFISLLLVVRAFNLVAMEPEAVYPQYPQYPQSAMIPPLEGHQEGYQREGEESERTSISTPSMMQQSLMQQSLTQPSLAQQPLLRPPMLQPGPVEQTGLVRVGDILLSVNGQSLVGLGIEAITEQLRRLETMDAQPITLLFRFGEENQGSFDDGGKAGLGGKSSMTMANHTNPHPHLPMMMMMMTHPPLMGKAMDGVVADGSMVVRREGGEGGYYGWGSQARLGTVADMNPAYPLAADSGHASRHAGYTTVANAHQSSSSSSSSSSSQYHMYNTQSLPSSTILMTMNATTSTQANNNSHNNTNNHNNSHNNNNYASSSSSSSAGYSLHAPQRHPLLDLFETSSPGAPPTSPPSFQHSQYTRPNPQHKGQGLGDVDPRGRNGRRDEDGGRGVGVEVEMGVEASTSLGILPGNNHHHHNNNHNNNRNNNNNNRNNHNEWDYGSSDEDENDYDLQRRLPPRSSHPHQTSSDYNPAYAYLGIPFPPFFFPPYSLSRSRPRPFLSYLPSSSSFSLSSSLLSL